MNQTTAQKSLSDVEKQFMKMTTVVQEIHVVLQNILESEELNKVISLLIYKQFYSSLTQTIATVKKFEPLRESLSFNQNHLFSKISECEEEEEQHSNLTMKIHSQISDNQLFCSKLSISRNELSISHVINKNEQLNEDNKHLTDKLKQAQRYIHKIEQVNQDLLRQGFGTSQYRSYKQLSYKEKSRGSITDRDRFKQKHIQQLKQQIDSLKQDLHETQQLINQNNQQFVRQLHQKNEKIWKLQRQIQNYKTRLVSSNSSTDQKQLYIQKLKQQNFRLQVTSRNMKMVTPSKHQKSYKQFSKLLKDRVATATSLDILGAFKKK